MSLGFHYHSQALISLSPTEQAEVRKSKLDNAALKRQAVGLSPTQDSVYQVVERASASVLSKLNRCQILSLVILHSSVLRRHIDQSDMMCD
eukprot:SAG31_NODE_1005_length_10432_cov_16.909909_9_plen_91_part_00